MRILILLLILTSCARYVVRKNVEDNLWAKVKTPVTGAPESLGTASGGCLKGGVQLTSSELVHLTDPERSRFFGHPELIRFIENLSTPGLTLFVGDLSQPRGGPMPGGHVSHQSGLDVDIFYRLTKAPVIADWTLADEDLLIRAARDPVVDRIFVNAFMKRRLCGRTRVPELRKIRPWFFHEDHFHVRIRCAVRDKKCVNPAPLPAGDGCDSTLEWWTSDEARALEVKGKQTNRELEVELPAECRSVLRH